MDRVLHIGTDSNVSINTDKGSFADTLKEFIGDIDLLQKESGQLTERFIKGEPVDLHEVMIAAEKSKTSFQLLVEMRNKFLDFCESKVFATITWI